MNAPTANRSNLVVLQGRVSSAPRQRDLPSGSTVVQLELTTRCDDVTTSVPVAWFDPTATIAPDDELLVVGHVRRRFFRAAGTTQSRTEVVADKVVKMARRRDVARALALAAAALVEPG